MITEKFANILPVLKHRNKIIIFIKLKLLALQECDVIKFSK